MSCAEPAVRRSKPDGLSPSDSRGPQYGVQLLTIPPHLIDAAAAITQQTRLLSNDALIGAVMQANGLTNLASHDADFGRVPGLSRDAPA